MREYIRWDFIMWPLVALTGWSHQRDGLINGMVALTEWSH